jgi:signal transduction histidine kinase
MWAGALRGCALGAVATLIAAAARAWLSPWLGPQAPLLAFPAVVSLAAWAGGVWAGVFATVTSGLVGMLLFVERTEPRTLSIDDAVLFGLFLAQGLFITGLTAGLRSSRERLRTALDTERHLRTAAQSAAHLKQEFLGIVSHELRTPLNVILGSVWKIRQSPDPTARQVAATIERNARAQAAVVSNLLYVSETLSGARSLSSERLDVTALCRDALQSVRIAAAEKRLVISVVAPDRDVVVEGDREALSQALAALLVNAIKFSLRGAQVSLGVTAAPSQVELTVTDTGVGIAPDVLHRVFDPFWQADASLTRLHGGMGLGLTAARHIVALHGGVLIAHSDGPGRGATFRMTLPRAADGTAAAEATEVGSERA